MEYEQGAKKFLTQIMDSPSDTSLANLIKLEFFHQIFWPDLCKQNVFSLARRNNYRLDELYINHPILGRNFYDQGEDPCEIGGVIDLWNNEGGTGVSSKSVYYYYFYGTQGNPLWYVLEDHVDFFQFDNAFLQEEESLTQVYEMLNTHRSLVAAFLTLAIKSYEDISIDEAIPDDLSNPNYFTEKYGFRLKDEVKDYLENELWSSGSFDIADMTVDVSLNPDFANQLAWSALTPEVKVHVFEWLAFGSNQEDTKLSQDSVHFLSCMALHESTPLQIKERLAQLNIELVDEVLNSI